MTLRRLPMPKRTKPMLLKRRRLCQEILSIRQQPMPNRLKPTPLS